MDDVREFKRTTSVLLHVLFQVTSSMCLLLRNFAFTSCIMVQGKIKDCPALENCVFLAFLRSARRCGNIAPKSNQSQKVQHGLLSIHVNQRSVMKIKKSMEHEGAPSA